MKNYIIIEYETTDEGLPHVTGIRNSDATNERSVSELAFEKGRYNPAVTAFMELLQAQAMHFIKAVQDALASLPEADIASRKAKKL